MPMRVTGLNSGLDTESIITALVEAKSEKKNKLVKAQTRLEWKQDAWKELNKKVYSFYTKTLSNMRMQGDYTKKITKSSNESAVSVITGSNAANGVQNLEVISQAKSGYLTGAELKDSGGTNKANYTSSTTLSQINGLNLTGGEKLTITVGGKNKDITLDGNMTINKLVSELRNAGVNANFDEKNQRFFISSKATGAANNFEIAASDSPANASASTIMQKLGFTGSDSNKIDGSDAEIRLNGATFTSDSNTFEINGLTITVNQETSEKITLNTTDDTDGIYDMIKNFFKEYNELIIEMDSLYNAESSKGYEPLTDEEKEALSEKEIEKWEEKIKNSILRKDSTLNTVSSAIKQIMLQGVKMSDGSQLYLSEFGIGTLGYFNAGENEKSAYHIDGDPDDSNVSNNDDKLRAAIASDPDKVTEFFSTLSKNLYDKLFDMMKTTEYSSAFTLYDDKLMKEEYSSYTSKISKQEALIKAYEDRYYKKFAAMETALSKLQTKENALAGMFGG